MQRMTGTTGRTQTERRAATRAALLEAVIDCIVEVGYSRTTTRMVAARAGISPGGQAHHFRTKAELVAEAIDHLVAEIGEQLLEEVQPGARPDRRAIEASLDNLWEVHCGRAFQVANELWVIARTDPELRECLGGAQRSVSARIGEIAARLLGDRVDELRASRATTTVLAAIRGLAMLRAVSEPDADGMWPGMRDQLSALIMDAIDG